MIINNLNVNGDNNITIQGTKNSIINIGNNNGSLYDQVLAKVQKGKLGEALDLLPDANEIILLKGQFSRVSSEKNRGTISHSDAERELNLIMHALLDYIDNNKSTIVHTGIGDIVMGNKIEPELIDPRRVDYLIAVKYENNLAARQDLLEFGQRLLGYLKSNCTPKLFDTSFQVLRYAVIDLRKSPTTANANKVIEALKEHRDTIVQLLASDAQETTLEALYNDARNKNTASEFIPKFEEYLSKYFALNTVPNKVEIVNRWNDQRKAELSRTGTDLVIKIKFDKFKSAWLEAFRPF